MTSAGAVYAKTAAGSEEVKSRRLKLAPKVRMMLILVDGSKPVLILREEAAALGAPADFIEQLERVGLVAPIAGTGVPGTRTTAAPGAKMDPVAHFRMAQRFMNDTAVNALGIKAFFFTLKMEKCATVDDLRGMVETYRAAIAKANGEAEADVLVRRLEEILG
jgi:hypothetical protein